MGLHILLNCTLRNAQLAVPTPLESFGLAMVDHARVILETAGNGIPAQAELFGNLSDTEIRFGNRGSCGHDLFLGVADDPSKMRLSASERLECGNDSECTNI